MNKYGFGDSTTFSNSEEESKISQRYVNNRTSTNVDFIYKVVLLGDSKVGKTAIVHRLIVIKYKLYHLLMI